MTTRSNALAASLDQAYRHWRERGALLTMPPAHDALPAMTIAISRERGAGGSEIARRLAERINWPLYDCELVDKIANDAGVSSELVAALDEHCPSWLSEAIQGFRSTKTITGVGFAIRLREILLALYCHGDCIILGRGAAQVLPIERTLRVRLIAPEKFRIKRMATKLGLTEKEAAAEVHEADKTRTQFVRSYFGRDPNDSRLYDFTIDTSRFPMSSIAGPIAAAMSSRREHVEQRRHALRSGGE
ncbi:MAG: cytidylate kinase-like family protein [Planctomycetota bacterium]